MIIHKNIDFKDYNSLKISYNVKLMFEVTNCYEIVTLLTIFKELNIEYFIIGNASKILFDKKDIIKPIIYINKLFSELYIFNNSIMVSSGYLLKELIIKLSNNNIGGFEKLYPIPASIGGLIYMNGGIKDYSISNIVRYVIIIDDDLKIKILNNKECDFSYRNSIFKNKKYVILYVILKTNKVDKNEILLNIKEALKYRVKNQITNKNTIGSLFKNKGDLKAYELISKTFKLPLYINGAYINKKHANFLICDNAEVDDVLTLINYIKEKVYDKYKYLLELELNILK